MLGRGGPAAPAAPTISVGAGTYEHIVTDPANALCALTYETNGDITISAGAGPSPGSWATPNSTGIGSSYDISFDGGGSWNNLSTARTISIGKSAGIGTNTGGPYDVRIRDAATLVQKASGSVTLMATVDGG